MLLAPRRYMDKIDELHIAEYERQLEGLKTIKPWFAPAPHISCTFAEAVNARRESINRCIELIKARV